MENVVIYMFKKHLIANFCFFHGFWGGGNAKKLKVKTEFQQSTQFIKESGKNNLHTK